MTKFLKAVLWISVLALTLGVMISLRMLLPLLVIPIILFAIGRRKRMRDKNESASR